MSLDPTDVYPKRNLPGEAEQWGRTIENDQVSLKKVVQGLRNSISALARSVSSSLSSIADQINRIASQQEELANAQEDIVDLLSTQTVTHTRNATVQPFTPPTGTSAVVCSTPSVPIPEGYTSVDVFLTAQASAYNTSGAAGYLYCQLDLNGTVISPLDASLYTDNNSTGTVVTSAARSYSLVGTASTSLTFSLRVKGDYSSWGSSASNNAYINALIIFSK